MGLEESLAYWQEYGQDFDLILMDENKEVYVTESLADFFTSDFSTHIVYKEG
jgi:thiamine biosynthesis lipoprotein